MIKDIGHCCSCGRQRQILLSNNPLVKGICLECLQKIVDPKQIKVVDMFCKTFNIPFIPDKWIAIAEDAEVENVFEEYVFLISEEYADTLYNGSPTGMLWDKIDKEYQRVKDHRSLLAKINTIQDEFKMMMTIKWGSQFELEQWMKLEDLYNNTVAKSGTTNALTLDIIKKIAITSVMQDDMLQQGDIKTAGELAKMNAQMIKSAGLDEMIEVTSGATITNIADLCDYLEKCGWQPPYYDGESRDIVDKTILDFQEWTRNFVRDSAGFDQDFESIVQVYEKSKEEHKSGEAASSTSIEELIQANLDKREQEFDNEFLEELDFAEVEDE